MANIKSDEQYDGPSPQESCVQMIFADEQVKGNCEDCGKVNVLYRTEACSHALASMYGGDCCSKYICIPENDCEFKCIKCKTPITNFERDEDSEGFIKSKTCSNCKTDNCIAFTWYGRTPQRARELLAKNGY